MLFAAAVETSRCVADTPRRLEKSQLLATLLRQLHLDEAEIVVAFLSGYTRQGRIGVGYAALRDAAAALTTQPAETASLEIGEVDRILSQLLAVEGPGSDRRKRDLLQSLLTRATAPEQSFLKGLLLGEIRQSALEGIMLEALAKASSIAPELVRRAAMMAGDIAPVARSALESGAAGLARYGIQ